MKTLKSLIPMCAWCRRIRDDKGYWASLEQYLEENAGSYVSHGICESCSEKLAPSQES